jgi:hypothetical protein
MRLPTLLSRVGLSLFACSLVYFGSGCSGGDSLHPAKGKISVNGTPAVGAQIMLFPVGKPDINYIPATATADAEGSFTLSTGKTPGAKAGKYVATVIWPDPNRKLTDAEKMQGLVTIPDLLKGRYASPEKSNIQIEITSGENALQPIEIK